MRLLIQFCITTLITALLLLLSKKSHLRDGPKSEDCAPNAGAVGVFVGCDAPNENVDCPPNVGAVGVFVGCDEPNENVDCPPNEAAVGVFVGCDAPNEKVGFAALAIRGVMNQLLI